MDECDHLRADNETKHDELTVLTHEHSVLKNELSIAKRDRDTYRSESDHYRSRTDQYAKECDFLKQENIRLLTQYEHMSSELSNLNEAHNIALMNSQELLSQMTKKHAVQITLMEERLSQVLEVSN